MTFVNHGGFQPSESKGFVSVIGINQVVSVRRFTGFLHKSVFYERDNKFNVEISLDERQTDFVQFDRLVLFFLELLLLELTLLFIIFTLLLSTSFLEMTLLLTNIVEYAKVAYM